MRGLPRRSLVACRRRALAAHRRLAPKRRRSRLRHLPPRPPARRPPDRPRRRLLLELKAGPSPRPPAARPGGGRLVLDAPQQAAARKPTVRSSVWRKSAVRSGSSRSAHSTCAFVHAASRARTTSHIATTSSIRWKRCRMRSIRPSQPGRNDDFTCASTCARIGFTRAKSPYCGPGSTPSSAHVATTATGRSRLMCAFIPASANWSGAIPRRPRASRSGSQARGACAGSARASKNSSAKTTSRCATNAGLAKWTPCSRSFTPSVTAR